MEQFINIFLLNFINYIELADFFINLKNYLNLSIKQNAIVLSQFNFFIFLKFIFFFLNNNLYYSFIFGYPIVIAVATLFLPFLGLRGVFELFFFILLAFWVSASLLFKAYFFENIVTKISIIKLFTFGNNYTAALDFNIDLISYGFSFLTLTIGFFTVIYAYSYFRNEPHVARLIIYINMFIYSMSLFVFSNNIISLFLGWELIGLTSFLLINFWSTKISSLKSAFKAFTFNKLSDSALLLFSICIVTTTGSTDITTILSLAPINNIYILFFNFNISIWEFFSILLILASSIKSAQIFFHIWLPDSMDAPVPASALIHSATLVSAGIYLMLRFHVILEMSWFYCNIVPFVAIITALYGGVISAFQTDLKKILAYSTISHCGFLMLLTCQNVVEFTLIYLYVHGFFKAASFLCAGNIIRFNKNIQDIRRAGQFWKYLVFELVALSVCLFNLAGLPFTLGFISKHFLFLNNFNFFFETIFITFLLLSMLSGLFYSTKIIYYVFFDFKKSNKTVYKANQQILALNLKFFTNSTLGSLLPIFSLILASYIIISYQLFFFIVSSNQKSDIFLNLSTSSYLSILNTNSFFNNNLYYFFWILTFLLFYIFYSGFSYKISSVTSFNYSINIIFIFIFIYLFKLFF